MFSSRKRFTAATLVALTILVALEPATAHAYVGPSAGVSFLGAALGVAVAMFSALGVILFWPIRVLVRKLRGIRTVSSTTALPAPEPDAPQREGT